MAQNNFGEVSQQLSFLPSPPLVTQPSPDLGDNFVQKLHTL